MTGVQTCALPICRHADAGSMSERFAQERRNKSGRSDLESEDAGGVLVCSVFARLALESNVL